MTVTHIIGGGLAGLACAVSLVEAGERVALYEAGPALGGRCRSYDDRALGCRLDNGNHLILSGNRAVFDWLDRFGMRHSLSGPGRAMFPFADLRDGTRWTLDLGRGRVPWWVLDRRRRVPGMRLGELASLGRLLRAGEATSVAACLALGALAERLLVPLAVSALNTPVETGSAALLAAVMRESLALGGAACVPATPAEGLSESLIDPARDWLLARGAVIRTGWRAAGLVAAGDVVSRIEGPEGGVTLDAGDRVVLAANAPVTAALASAVLPGLVVPDAFEAIVNLHYRHEDRLTPGLARAAGDVGRAGFVGVIGGLAEWIFLKPGVVSVTISAANHLADREAEGLAAQVWGEIRAALPPAAGALLPEGVPAYRLVREKRATFAATPEQARRRPGTRTARNNLFLAGDWTATGLPATIEGALRSGHSAAKACLAG
ncbi:squalene-associated FAD-dependent desaturase [Endobacter medicaginis]|uniref:Squalene-associated FAD-dependent desaturase n=5 Tax=Endobacter medicaginis TaxID=1181271 RepID=A0A839UQ80_9PROT|nr:hydroxysqualene dehydroxylase HpnE [Endobacter medicaginis]MBB3172348.1 squalene-associated FAD-dependent desaturase [Endobacter medicaginis]